MPTVFVTGANGYIAQHLVVQLIEKGYSVVGTVRSKEKGESLVANLPKNFQYEVVSDIVKPGAFDEALKKHPEVVGFFHTASPVSMVADDVENDIIRPAIEGTKNVLSAVQQFGTNVKRFVYTSSNAAIVSPTDNKDSVVTEESWCNLGRHEVSIGLPGYKISKTYAEKEVWASSEKSSFTFNIVNPTFVFGPQAFASEAKGTLNFSADLITRLASLKEGDEIPPMVGGFVDVRDVARAHIFAYETELDKTRLYLFEEKFTSQLAVDIIRENFPELASIPKGDPSTALDFGNSPQIDNKKTRALVGPFIGLKQSVIDTVQQVLENN
ncbi:nucleoside-diphosphate-sugar epimerase [Yamadazyma tenuis]|uniref:nucleoside-diphosphate-sugar epimerase n=1 Tax=Candida tenuis TaxID=2315449 RepID=UPI00279D5470|nr:nucleoside-diphosphate-sugar epimerase [Yamadazyma tenuis]